MLRWRILLGAVFIAALVGLFWLDFIATPGVWLFGLAIVVGLAAAQEVLDLLASGGHHPLRGIIYGGNLLVIASNAIPLFWMPPLDDQPGGRLGWPLIALALCMLAALAAEISRYQRPGEAIVNVALAMFAISYVGVLMSFALQLRMLGGPVTGMVALMALIAVVKLGDIGAYIVGRLAGRHKMAPLVSPGKTLEGAVGAIAFACLGSWLVHTYVPLWLGSNRPDRPLNWLVFGVAVGAAGLLGDLAESLFKRDMGRKDSSTWLPGFGGVLDLLDSILFAAPVAYLWSVVEMT